MKVFIQLQLALLLVLSGMVAQAQTRSMADVAIFPSARETRLPLDTSRTEFGAPVLVNSRAYLVDDATPEEVFLFYQGLLDGREYFQPDERDPDRVAAGESSPVVLVKGLHSFESSPHPERPSEELSGKQKRRVLSRDRQPLPGDEWLSKANFQWFTRLTQERFSLCQVVVRDLGLAPDWQQYHHQVLVVHECVLYRDAAKPQVAQSNPIAKGWAALAGR